MSMRRATLVVSGAVTFGSVAGLTDVASRGGRRVR